MPMEVGGLGMPNSSTRQCLAVTTARLWTRVPLQPMGFTMMAVGHWQVVAALPPTMARTVGGLEV